MIALSRVQFLRAYYLAAWFNHYWTIAARALFRGNFTRQAIAECDAALSAQYGAGAILPATVNALAAKLATPGANAIQLTVTDGCVRHTTASGRLSWAVAQDGSVVIEVTRPVPELQEAYDTLRGRARALTVGLLDLEPAITEIDADAAYEVAHVALLEGRKAKVSEAEEAALRATREAAYDACETALAVCSKASERASAEDVALISRIRGIAQDMNVPSLLDGLRDVGVARDVSGEESVAATRAFYVAMRDMREGLLARVNADLAALPPESHVVLRATISPEGDDAIEHVENRPISRRHVEALEGCLLALHQDFDYARASTAFLWRVVDDFEEVTARIAGSVSEVWTNSLTRVSGHGASFRTLTSTKEAIDRLMEARARLAHLYACRA